MGSGTYCYADASLRSTTYATASSFDSSYLNREIFTKRSLDEKMNIKGKIRESRDSDEHPTSFPIIIGLDVTGSMGSIPKYLITKGFPELMKKIMDEGVDHAQVCFMGIGDHECDTAPIQVGQFETSDELQEKWLTSVYLEGGGGGNDGEATGLVWYVAAKHVVTDSFEKHHRKGVLITIGDEPVLETIPEHDLKDLFGEGQGSVNINDILNEARESWDVYHINVVDYSGSRKKVQDQWKQLLGEHAVNTQSNDGSDVPDIIAGIVINSYNNSRPTVLNENILEKSKVEPSIIL